MKGLNVLTPHGASRLYHLGADGSMTFAESASDRDTIMHSRGLGSLSKDSRIAEILEGNSKQHLGLSRFFLIRFDHPIA